MEKRIVITGVGVISSLGESPAALHTALCEGRSGLKRLEMFDPTGLSCQIASEASSFSARHYLGEGNLRSLDRTAQLVTSAARLALDHSGWTAEMRRSREAGLVLGTMFCSLHTISQFDRRALAAGPSYASPMDFANTVINAAAGQAAIWHDLRGVNSTIAASTAAGLQAIAYAIQLIHTDHADAILAGGADELCFETALGFDRAKLLCGSGTDRRYFPIPFDSKRNGFALGEGCGLLMLEELGSASARGANILGEIKGYGSTFDCSRGKDAKKAIDAIEKAMALAISDAGVTADEIDCLSASANGSPLGDLCEALAVAAMFGRRSSELPVAAIKSMLGETLGASGPLQIVDILEVFRDGVLPGIRQLTEADKCLPLKLFESGNWEASMNIALINSVGLDGNCCSVVVGRFK